MTDLQNLLDQIDRLDKKSTPGRWVANEGTLKNREGWSIFVDEHNNTVTSATPGDADFIATVRAAMPLMASALQVVIDLHQPTQNPRTRLMECMECASIQTFVAYPCPTVRAITDAMEGDDE